MTDLVVMCTKQHKPDPGAVTAGVGSDLSCHLEMYCGVIRIYLVFVPDPGTELQHPLEGWIRHSYPK